MLFYHSSVRLSRTGEIFMLCKKCKAEMPENAVYCPFCGSRQDYCKQDKKRTRTRPNGTGSVYKSGNSYTAEVTLGWVLEDGHIKRVKKKKKGFKTKKEALAYLPVLSNKTAPDTVTLQNLWEVFHDNTLPKLSESKQTHYRTAYKKIKGIVFTDIKLLSIKDLQDVVNRSADTYYPAKDIKTLLSQLYDRAVAQGAVQTNIAKYIELPNLEETSPNPFNGEEIGRLWMDYAKGNYITGYALLMIYTGMMPGELLDLRCDMIDLRNRVIVGVGKKTKKRKTTPIVLASDIVPVVEELIHHSKNGKFLPMGEKSYRREFREMLLRCQCRPELVPYSCRHTTATNLVQEAAALPIVKEVMRHTKITTTERYVHVDTERMLDAVDKLKKI